MNLKERDKKHIWHPLTQHKTFPDVLGIAKAKGLYLYDESGNAYIDAISSWYTCVYGHCNPYITERVIHQMHSLDQIIFSGLTHEPAVMLSEKLIPILPENQNKIFFSENGSTATEVGVKMAFQYHFNRGEKRLKFLAFEEGFHGDTFGAMSCSGLSIYNGAFEPLFLPVGRIPTPKGENNTRLLEQAEALISKNEVAGFIYEPLIQGAAGMKIYDKQGLEDLLKLCKAYNVITIADEVMTGFGKTGRYFASDFLHTKPDIVCLSKALTAGLIPMGLTTCSQEIFRVFYDDDVSKGFFHGHTYSANPLACIAACASIELLTSQQTQYAIESLSKQYQEFASRLKTNPHITDIRHLGPIFAFDLNIKAERYGNLRQAIYEHFLSRGVFLRPLGNTVYLLPPYIITGEEMEYIYTVIDEFVTNKSLW